MEILSWIPSARGALSLLRHTSIDILNEADKHLFVQLLKTDHVSSCNSLDTIFFLSFPSFGIISNRMKLYKFSVFSFALFNFKENRRKTKQNTKAWQEGKKVLCALPSTEIIKLYKWKREKGERKTLRNPGQLYFTGSFGQKTKNLVFPHLPMS